MALLSIALALAISSVCHQDAAAFVSPSPSFLSSVVANQQRQLYTTITLQQKRQRHHGQFQLFSTTDTDLDKEISSMRVSAIKEELESYGISTRTFLEKGELVDALVQARKEGKTPISSSSASSSSSTSSTASSSSSSTTTSSSSSSTSSSTAASSADRTERLQAEREKCKSLKVSELKSELESYGVSTNTFFEKSEFVRALAEARVSGVVMKSTSSKKKKRRAVDDDEVEEVTAAKVEVITNDSEGPKTKKSRDASTSDASADAGGNPFGGAGGAGGERGGMGGMDMGGFADMFKGMGGMGGAPGGGGPGGMDMGGIADMLKGMGGMGGGAPGGGAGMGDAMKAAQQAMSNPKVMAVIQKAQKNPKVMAAVQECMGNPMAMTKYMSDPEVGPILQELQDAMK
mmetsp:Transcript_27766/g.50118  ORF Transcript_27766/g.50118 Transcript_27766/m.50118 type:complete len:403 (+) Transcript_27766:137-1345(+)